MKLKEYEVIFTLNYRTTMKALSRARALEFATLEGQRLVDESNEKATNHSTALVDVIVGEVVSHNEVS